MTRRSVVLVTLAILVGYAGLGALGLAELNTAQRLRTLESKIEALSRQSPAPTGEATTAGPPRMVNVTDSLGNPWPPCTPVACANLSAVRVQAGTTILFTAHGSSPTNRPLQYAFSVGNGNYVETLCEVSSNPTCRWVAAKVPVTADSLNVVAASVRDDLGHWSDTPVNTYWSVGP